MKQPLGEKQDGDIAVVTLWGGNRQQTGRATGRIYPRNGNGKLAWVSPEDVKAAPELYREASEDELKVAEERRKEQREAVSNSRRRSFQQTLPEAQTTPPMDYKSMSLEGLKDLAEKLNLEITGTGKDGNILKGDYVTALEAHDAPRDA